MASTDRETNICGACKWWSREQTSNRHPFSGMALGRCQQSPPVLLPMKGITAHDASTPELWAQPVTQETDRCGKFVSEKPTRRLPTPEEEAAWVP